MDSESPRSKSDLIDRGESSQSGSSGREREQEQEMKEEEWRGEE